MAETACMLVLISVLPTQYCPHSTSVLQAVAGADHNISLISIVEARVVSLFKGDIQDRLIQAW